MPGAKIGMKGGIKMYCAVIGDIIESKKIERRSEVQAKLKKTLDEVNEMFREDIASKFTITLGDEFQGLLKGPDALLNIIEKIKVEMYPQKIRFGIGIGDIYTEINREMAIGADGPAYHNARKMLGEIKKAERSKVKKDAEIMICSQHEKNIGVDGLINAAFSLCSYIEKKWTGRQREVIFDYIRHGDNQRKAAGRFGVTQSTIQRILKNSGFYNYLHAKEAIQDFLIKYWGRMDV